jgi:hypothetical protein
LSSSFFKVRRTKKQTRPVQQKKLNKMDKILEISKSIHDFSARNLINVFLSYDGLWDGSFVETNEDKAIDIFSNLTKELVEQLDKQMNTKPIRQINEKNEFTLNPDLVCCVKNVKALVLIMLCLASSNKSFAKSFQAKKQEFVCLREIYLPGFDTLHNFIEQLFSVDVMGKDDFKFLFRAIKELL